MESRSCRPRDAFEKATVETQLAVDSVQDLEKLYKRCADAYYRVLWTKKATKTVEVAGDGC